MSLYLIIKGIPHTGLPLNLASDSFTLVGHKTPAPIPITLSFLGALPPQGASVWLSQVFIPPGAELKVQLGPKETVLVSCHCLPSRPNKCSTQLPRN